MATGPGRNQEWAIIRKNLGYDHIPQQFETEVNAFCRDALNPYLNFDRPSSSSVRTAFALRRMR
jgi:hypothetical protein